MAAANADLPDARHMVLRIGVNLGDVIVEGSDLYGDGVNIAARLEGIAEPGGIAISGTAFDYVKNKVKAGFEELGAQTLKNIAEPVRIYRVTCTPRVAVPTSKAAMDKASIAVLPFINMSGDPEQEYFADGLTEDIITALSRVSGLTVIARTSSFTYKAQKVEVRRVAKELDVRYIMEGSVRRASNRVRVTAQLIDGITGHHVWAERYDRSVGDLFDIHDDIVRSIAATAEIQIQLSEPLRIETRAINDLKAGELAMRAWSRVYDFTAEAFSEATELAEQAIRLEPKNARAHIIRARVHLDRLWFGLIPHDEANVVMGLQFARSGLRLAPRDEWAHWCMAFAYEQTGQLKEMRAECERAIELNPNFSIGYGGLGRAFAFLGQPMEAIEACQVALRLNPRDPSNFDRHAALAIANFVKEDYEAAFQEAETVTQGRPESPEGHILRAAAASALGKTDEAQSAVAECIARWPNISLANVSPSYIPRFFHVEHHQRLLAMLLKAGLQDK
jgi:adenylate cyclase